MGRTKEEWKVPDPFLQKSSDVRKLRECCLCGRVGLAEGGLIRLVVQSIADGGGDAAKLKKRASVAHPWCYVQEMSIENLLMLDRQELETIRLGDLPPKYIKVVLDVLAEDVNSTGGKFPVSQIIARGE